jgi:hypothetical protein
MGPEEKAYEIKQIGYWPFETYQIQTDLNKIDNRLGFLPITNHFPLVYNAAYQFGPLYDVEITDYDFGNNIIRNYIDDESKFYVDFENGNTFYWNSTGIRNLYDGKIYNSFFIELNNPSFTKLLGYVFYPTRLFLKPVSVEKVGNSWQLRTSAILLSANPVFFETFQKMECALDINRLYTDNFDNKIEIPINNDINLIYSVSAIQKFVNKPVINFTDTYNPNRFTIALEPINSKLKKDHINVNYRHIYFDEDGNLDSIESPPIFNNNENSYFKSSLFNWTALNPNNLTFLMLQSAVNRDINLNSVLNCVLSANINTETTVFLYQANSRLNDKTLVLAVSGDPNVYTGIRYIADCPYFRNTLENVHNTLLDFQNLAASNNVFNVVNSQNTGFDNTLWELKYPPHHYSFNVSFSADQYNKFTEESSIVFDLSSKIIQRDIQINSENAVLSTYLFSEFGLMTMDLETYGIFDQIKFDFSTTESTFLSAICCYYDPFGSNKYYDVFSSPWIPATSGSLIKIEYPNKSLGEITISILPKLSTYAGFLDSFYKTDLVLAENEEQIFDTLNIYQELIDEGSDYTETTCAKLTSEEDFPFKDLQNSLISWSFEPSNIEAAIYNIYNNTYTLIQPNSSIWFSDLTHTVRFSGYGPFPLILKLSSQKYNQVALLTATSSLFNFFQDRKLGLEKIDGINNLNEIRTITLSAFIPAGNKKYPIPIGTPLFLVWRYNDSQDLFSIPITAIDSNNQIYGYSNFGTVQSLSSIKFNIQPPQSNSFPFTDEIEISVGTFTENGLLVGNYIFELDHFPDKSIFDADFYVFYKDLIKPNEFIAHSKTQKVLTLPADSTAKYFLRASDNILNTTTNTTLVWNISNSNGFVSVLNGVSSFYYDVTARITNISLSAINTIANGWTSAHNTQTNLTIYSIPTIELSQPLQFIIYPEFYWVGKNIVLTNTSNFTNSLRPSAYENNIIDTYSFWVSSNKQLEKYYYSTNELKTSAISLINIPFSNELKTSTGKMISLTAFGKEFPEENGLFYKASSINGLVTRNYNLTAQTLSANSINVNSFLRSPIIVPFTDATFNFTLNTSSINLEQSRFVTVTQTVSTNPLNSPVQPIGGSITYKLSSNFWVVESNVPATNGTFTPFALSLGDSFTPLNVDSKNASSLYLTAEASILKTIPENTFINFPNYDKTNKTWKTVTQKVTSSQVNSIFAFITSKDINLYISDYYNIVGNDITFEYEDNFSKLLSDIDYYVIDFGDNKIETVNNNSLLINHTYDNAGTFIITLSAVYKNGDLSILNNNKEIQIYSEWPIYQQDDLRFLDDTNLQLPYNLEEIEIQPNEYGITDIFNTSIERLQKNLDFLNLNTQTLDSNTPTFVYGWLGLNKDFISNGITWHTIDYKNVDYRSYEKGSSLGFLQLKRYFEKDFLIALDEYKIRIFKKGKTPEEIKFVNEENSTLQFIKITDLCSNDNGDVLFITDNINNKIHRIDLDIDVISYIYDTLDIGGFGNKDDINKFNNPLKIKYYNGFVYVLDYNNNCIKKYTEDLMWVSTHFIEENQIENFSVHKSSSFLYIIDNLYNIHVLDGTENIAKFTLSSFLDNQIINDIEFDFNNEFLYIITNSNIYKFNSILKYIGILSTNDEFKSLSNSETRVLNLIKDNIVLRINDIVNIFEMGKGRNKIKWNLSQITIDKDEFAQDISYNRSFKRMTQNVKNFRDCINSKFVLVTENTSSGVITYFSQIPVKKDNLPIFIEDIENENIGVGADEFHIPQVINRELKKIYDSIVSLKNFFDINPIAVSSNGCKEGFCWSWKAMACYNLSLPIIRICNINPITWAELKSSFNLSQINLKKWDDASSNCCNKIKSPLG